MVINVVASVTKQRWMHTVEPARLQFSVLFHDDVCCVGTKRKKQVRGKIDAGGGAALSLPWTLSLK